MKFRKLKFPPRLATKKRTNIVALWAILMVGNMFVTRIRNISESGFD